MSIARTFGAPMTARIPEAAEVGFLRTIGTIDSCGAPPWPRAIRAACCGLSRLRAFSKNPLAVRRVKHEAKHPDPQHRVLEPRADRSVARSSRARIVGGRGKSR